MRKYINTSLQLQGAIREPVRHSENNLFNGIDIYSSTKPILFAFHWNMIYSVGYASKNILNACVYFNIYALPYILTRRFWEIRQ